jgi:hypothetical protein
MKYLSIIILIIFCSCTQKEKKYIYTEQKQQTFPYRSYNYKEPEVVSALNDSVAFCKAYKKYYNSCKAYEQTKNLLENKGLQSIGDIPVAFTLMDETGNDISGGYFLADRDKVKKEIEDQIDLIVLKSSSNQ